VLSLLGPDEDVPLNLVSIVRGVVTSADVDGVVVEGGSSFTWKAHKKIKLKFGDQKLGGPLRQIAI
jgi:hypothetical protein